MDGARCSLVDRVNSAKTVGRASEVPITLDDIYSDRTGAYYFLTLHAPRLCDHFNCTRDMKFDNGNRPFIPQQDEDHIIGSRPATTASVATSASSFRIPGIGPSVGPSGANPVPRTHPSAEENQAPTSFVRLFAPQADNIDASWHARQRDRKPAVPCFTAGAQDSPLFDQLPRPSFQRDRSARAPVSAGSWQSDDQVRPFTASSYHRSKLVTADGFVGNYVCALIENRGTGREVGIASVERDTGMFQHDEEEVCRLREGSH